MSRTVLFDSAVTSPSVIDTSYAAAASIAVRAGRACPLVLFCNLAGPTSLEVSVDFGIYATAEAAPSVADDTQWYSLVTKAGAALSTEVSLLPGRSLLDPSTKLTGTADALVWRGFVPQGVGWLRFRLKRTGNAVTALTLSLLHDAAIISG